MHFCRWSRREFITFLSGAAAWPLAARAQAPPMPVIGFLSTLSRGRPAWPLAAFRQALEGAGYVEGRNLAIEYRWAEGRYERLPEMAADLVHHNVAVIAATGGLVSAKAAKAVTPTIPVLFIAGFDPVQEGLVASMSRPGGNATGVTVFSAELGRKRLQLLHELVGAGRIAMLVNPGAISTAVETRDLEEAVRELNLEGAARGLNFQLLIVTARTDGDLEQAFDQAVRWGAGALLVSADSFFTDSHVRIVELAAGHALPASYPWPQYVDAGGLISYGTTLTWAYGQIGAYAARILKGEKPADLPVHMPSTFELAINLTTARSLGLTIPPNLLVLAQKIVE